MGGMPYFKFYPADWLAGTLDLTLEERGAYLQFLAWSWINGRPLPLDAAGRSRILGISTRQLPRLWKSIEHHWVRTPEGFVNRRLAREFEKAEAEHKARVAAGKKGGRPKGGDGD